MAKKVFCCICSFVVTSLLYLYFQTQSSFEDIVASNRISLLKDRPSNITRDIIVDISTLNEKGGILTLTQFLISDIARKRPNWRLLILITKGYKQAYDLPNRNNVKLIEVDSSINPFIFVDQILNPKCFGLFHDKFEQLLYYDRIFCDQFCDLVWDPVGDSSCCNFVTVPRISTIHDLACFDVDSKFFATKNHRLRARICTQKAIHFSKKIITVSKFSQGRICDKFRVSKDFVRHIPINLGARVYLDSSEEKSIVVLNKYKLKPKKYFIFCSSWWRNKNHGALIQAFTKFAQKNSEIKLILVGKSPKLFQSRPIEEFCSDRLIISGFVPDEELSILLKDALAFIHPSVYEGFGMPVIEAMTNGVPVACSNISSLPEVAGSAALLFDPFNINSITEAMHKLANDSQLRKDLIKKGYKQAKKYADRDRMTDAYIRLMEEVMTENDSMKTAAN